MQAVHAVDGGRVVLRVRAQEPVDLLQQVRARGEAAGHQPEQLPAALLAAPVSPEPVLY